jgi:hypothetical protein
MANLYSVALILWSVLTQRDPPTAGRPLSTTRLRSDLDGDLARAIDGALAPTPSSRFVAEQKLVKYLGGRVTDHDREELRWNMEVLRALLVVDDLVCSTALPPTRPRVVLQSLPPPSGGPTRRMGGDDDDPGPTRRAPRAAPAMREEDAREELPSESDMATPQFQKMEPIPKAAAFAPELPALGDVNPVIGFLKRARSSYPPMPEVFPARPVLFVVAIAVTLAFASGVVVGRFTLRTPTPVATPTPAPRPPSPPPMTQASAPRQATASAAPSASADVIPLAASAAALPPTQGLLIVDPETADAFVYVNGRFAGPTKEPLAVPCGARFVRLGTRPLKKWFGKGQVVQVKCRDVTNATLKTE